MLHWRAQNLGSPGNRVKPCGMVVFETLQENLESVKQRMAAAAARCGRQPADVQLLAVSKTWPVEVLELAVKAGVSCFGENRVQELEEKVSALPAHLDWHLIGPLQKNKVRRALSLAGKIHSIDSLELAQRLDRIAADEGRVPEVYWQVHVGDEASKSGFSEERLRRSLEDLLDLRNQKVLGLMAIPPFTPDPEDARPFFSYLREFRDELSIHTGLPLPGLSMGMSHDFEVAIEEGATIVRVGSALFGGRG